MSESHNYQALAKTALYLSDGDTDDAIINTSLALGCLLVFRPYEDMDVGLPAARDLAIETIDRIIKLLSDAPEQVREALKRSAKQ
jgi:hypothetical protein